MSKRFLFVLSFFLLAILASAQPGNPNTPVPLDGGVSFLVAAGAALGGKKLYDAKKAQ